MGLGENMFRNQGNESPLTTLKKLVAQLEESNKTNKKLKAV
jgi:hypothetical protein